MGSTVNDLRRKAGLRSGNRWLRPDRYNRQMWQQAGLTVAATVAGGAAGAKVGGAVGGTAAGQYIGGTAAGTAIAGLGATAAGLGAAAGAGAVAHSIWDARQKQKRLGSGGGGGGGGGFEGFDPMMPEMSEMSDINWANFFDTGGTDVGGPARVGTLDPLGVRSRRSRGTAGLRGNRDRTLGQSATIASAAARAGLNLPV